MAIEQNPKDCGDTSKDKFIDESQKNPPPESKATIDNNRLMRRDRRQQPAKPAQTDTLGQTTTNVGRTANVKRNMISSKAKLHREKSSVPKSRWWQTWQFWGILLIICSGGMGYAATSMLLSLPKTQSCNRVFWPFASAAVRIYCAQTAAENGSVKGLLEAIDLVAVLPEDHPLHSEINRNVEKWATKILEVGETEFQQGNLKQAIKIARQVPKKVEARSLVEDKIDSWQEIWQRGEKNYAEIEKRLRDANWGEAFSWAVRLTEIPNQYWATTKYQESINNINIAQEENATLYKAEKQLESGDLDGLFYALDKADEIDKDSYAYQQAREILAKGKNKLLAIIDSSIEEGNWRQLLRVVNRIPQSLELGSQVREWNILASAGTSADLDTVFGLEEAIVEARKLDKDSSYYQLAQRLIARWELEIDDVAHLTEARQLAQLGTVKNLNMAISEANLIPSSNPRYSEAQQEIAEWRRDIQIIEDRPILDRATELAVANNPEAWRRAISEAQLVSANSPLYSEARNYISRWQYNIQRQEDLPYLERAESLANIENYLAAIAEADKIGSGRALYQEAQNKISLWRSEIAAEEYLRQAYDLEEQGTPQALAKAIEVARQTSSSSSRYSEVVENANRWSQEILDMAQRASFSSLRRAIAIAQLVPRGTTAHSQALDDIQRWETELNPPEPEAPLPPRFKLEKREKNR
ncbi:hypothetical protein [Myxosarcina sp. GI1]|uniref:hypothetical protein n=1 Tax=Myxosarcina sp. GI1 TaxID=1541065 RepID=UPI00068CA320|nr:hypothetical protein [Myxosarcina sp. GI1]